MKLACVLIAFTFVNVLAINLAKYKEEMYITNYQLDLIDKDYRLGKTDESKVDKLIVHLLHSNLPIQQMVILLATPESPNPDLEPSAAIERRFQTVIQTTNDNIDEPPIKGINFDQTELSDFGEARRNLIYPSLKRIHFAVQNGSITLDHDPLRVCYLLALLISSLDPKNAIRHVEHDSQGCTLVSVILKYSYYKQYADGIYKLDSRTGGKGSKFGFELV